MTETKDQEVHFELSTIQQRCWVYGIIGDVRVNLVCRTTPDEVARTMRLVEKLTRHAWAASEGRL